MPGMRPSPRGCPSGSATSPAGGLCFFVLGLKGGRGQGMWEVHASKKLSWRTYLLFLTNNHNNKTTTASPSASPAAAAPSPTRRTARCSSRSSSWRSLPRRLASSVCVGMGCVCVDLSIDDSMSTYVHFDPSARPKHTCIPTINLIDRPFSVSPTGIIVAIIQSNAGVFPNK